MRAVPGTFGLTWFKRRIGLLTSFALSALQQQSDACPGTRAVRVLNAGRHVVQTLFVAAGGSRDWGRDRLSAPLAPGQIVEIVLTPSACAVGVRAAYEDGREIVIAEVEPGALEVVLRY